jgi:hypothetical protein
MSRTDFAQPALASGRGVPMREIGAIAALGMEIALLIPWWRALTVSTNALGTSRALLLLGSAALLAMILARAAVAMDLSPAARRALLLVALAGVFLAAIRIVVYRGVPVGILALIVASFRSFQSVVTLVPAEVVVVLGVLYAWRRGVAAAAADALDPGWTAYKMRLGILGYVVFALIYGPEGSSRLLEILPFYFAAGLAGIALSRADALRRLPGAGRSPFAGQWLLGMGFIVVGTVALGMLAADALVSPTALRLVGRVGQGALDALEIVLRLGRPLILGIVTLLDRLLTWLVEITRFDPALLRLRELLPQIPAPAAEPSPAPGILAPYRAPLQVIGTTVVIALLAVLAVGASRRYSRRGRALWEDRSESLPLRPPRTSRLRGILAAAQSRFGRVRRFGRHLLAAAAIRRIYARLLDLAEARGRIRAPAETPREFMPHLWALFPDLRAEVELITEEYLRVRYGEYPEAVEAVARVRAAWSELLRAARRGSGRGVGGTTAGRGSRPSSE